MMKSKSSLFILTLLFFALLNLQVLANNDYPENDTDRSDKEKKTSLSTEDISSRTDSLLAAIGLSDRIEALGYLVTTSVTTEGRQGMDFSRLVIGQATGFNVNTTSGVSGSATNLYIRGHSSFFGSSEPLIIVDGVRFEGSADHFDRWDSFAGLNVQNRFIDLDPAFIKDITVLNNLSSTVLYGEEGRNGVILITTESGNFRNARQDDGFDLKFTQSLYSTSISSRPDYQDQYGSGANGFYGEFLGSWGPSFDEDNPSAFGNAFRGFDEDGTVLVRYPSSIANQIPSLQDEEYRYEARPNPVDAFFRSGLGSSSHLSMSGVYQGVQLNVNYLRSSEDGFTPGNNISRNSFGFGASYAISDRLHSRTTVHLSQLSTLSPPVSIWRAGGVPMDTNNIYNHIFTTPRSIDIDLPHVNPATGGSVYYRTDQPNPRWLTENAVISNDTDRYFGKTELQFRVTDWMTLSYRVGYDSFTELREQRYNLGGMGHSALNQGYFLTSERRYRGWDNILQAEFFAQLTDRITLRGMAGGQYKQEQSRRTGIESTDMIVSGIFRHSNFLNQRSQSRFSSAFLEDQFVRETAAVFSTLTFGYNDYLYLNLAGRNDWFSSLAADNRSVFNPAISVSYLVSDHLDFGGDLLSSLRLFGGYGSTVRSPEPYQAGLPGIGINRRAFIDPSGSVIPVATTSNFGNGPQLKPEQQSELNAGFDIGFLNGRAGFRSEFYTRTIRDIILQTSADPSTGHSTYLVNAGEMNINGYEITAYATPVTGTFRWDSNLVFYRSNSEVTNLPDGIDRLNIGGFNFRGSVVKEGQPFGVLYGSTVRRVTEELKNENPAFANAEAGTPILTQAGFLQFGDEEVMGNPNPDWQLSFQNSFRYRGFTLTLQADYQHGGDMFTTWGPMLMQRGVISNTTANRDEPIVVGGVNSAGEPVTAFLTAEDYYGLQMFGPDEARVYDMTHLRLSYLELSWNLPLRIVERTPFAGMEAAVSATNLWLHMPNVPDEFGFEPNVNSLQPDSNAAGFEFLSGPGARTIGGSLSVRF